MSESEQVTRLRKGVVGTLEGLAQEIAAMAPACDTVAFMTAAATAAFVLTPAAFLIAMLTMYLEVNTLYHLSRRHASAGGYYGYIATAFGPLPAIVSGLVYVLYQVASTAAIPVYVGGVVIPGVLQYFFNVSLPGWTWVPLVVAFVIAPIALSAFGIRPQMKYVKYAALTEVAFLAVTSAIIIIKAPDNTLAVFNPLAWSSVYGKRFSLEGGPFAALGLGMIFGITSFIGYGGSAPLGEESKHSRLITRALTMGVLLVGAVLTEVAYALTVGWGVDNMVSFANSNIPGIIVYTGYMGIAGGLLLALFALNLAFSDSVAMQSNAGRMYFAMARDGVLPKSFAKIHPRWVTPANSLWFIGATSSVLAVLSGFVIAYFTGVSPIAMLTSPATSTAVFNALTNGFDFLTTVALVGMITAHFLLNTSVITLFYRLKEKHYGMKKLLHPIQHYIMPGVATAIFAFVLYESVVPPIFPYTQAVAASVVFLLFSVGYGIWIKRKKPEVYKKAGRRVNIVEEEMEGTAKKT